MIALIAQSRSVDLQEIFKYPLGSVPYALADSMGTMVKTKKLDLQADLERILHISTVFQSHPAV